MDTQTAETLQTSRKKTYMRKANSFPVVLCKCGGKGVIWLEIVKAEVFLYWVECNTCHKWTEETRTEVSAVQNWNDRQNGVITRRRHHIINVGF